MGVYKKKRILRAFKRSKDYKKESNDQALKKITDSAGYHNCQYCPPWKMENKVARVPKRGAKKPRKKDKR